MQKLLLISGLIGSGKSTAAQALFSKLDNVALIKADKMVDFEPFEIGEKLLRIKMRNCSALIETYRDEGFEHIICEGFVQNQFELSQVEAVFSSTLDIHVFWLELDRATRQQRVENRGQGTDDDPAFLNAQEASNSEPWPFISSASKLHEIKVAGLKATDTVNLILSTLE